MTKIEKAKNLVFLVMTNTKEMYVHISDAATEEGSCSVDFTLGDTSVAVDIEETRIGVTKIPADWGSEHENYFVDVESACSHICELFL